MPFAIIYHHNARKDIEDAIKWENKRKLGLAVLFLKDLDKKVSSISITPGIGSIRYDNIRCTITKCFHISYLCCR